MDHGLGDQVEDIQFCENAVEGCASAARSGEGEPRCFEAHVLSSGSSRSTLRAFDYER